MNDDVYFSSETMWYMNQIWFFVSSVFCRKQLILMINSLVVVCWPQPPPSPKPQPISDGMLRFKTENRKILIKLSNLLLFFWVFVYLWIFTQFWSMISNWCLSYHCLYKTKTSFHQFIFQPLGCLFTLWGQTSN